MSVRPAVRRVGTAIMTASTALALTACTSSPPKAPVPPKKVSAEVPAIRVGTAGDSTGPAVQLPGSKRGGTVKDSEQLNFTHLDPAQVYSSDQQNVAQLFLRQLTGYKEVDGKFTLVGDLATDTGTTTDGGKTWTYKLKSGITFDDGNPITSADVKYGVERTFQSAMNAGAGYLPTWLLGADYAKTYQGPWNNGGDLPDSVISTPDAKTVVFHLKAAHTEFPFVVAMAASGPVEKSQDTQADYDHDPASTGPYKISSHSDTAMTLVRNPHWDPATDPIRSALPDEWDFTFGAAATAINGSMESSTDASVTLSTTLGATDLAKVAGDGSLKARQTGGPSTNVWYFAVNTSRISDVNVRKALLLAFPKQQVRALYGGPAYGDFATTILSPTVFGFKQYDLYKANAYGDPEAAKALLAKTLTLAPTITYAYRQDQTGTGAKVADTIKTGLEKAGFHVVLDPVPSKSWYSVTGKKDNGIDLSMQGWGSDWPTGSGTIPTLFDGRNIADGTYNYSRYNNEAVNHQIDALTAMSDQSAAAAGWMSLDQQIMADVPVIPFVYSSNEFVYGSGMGGVQYNELLSALNPAGMFVK